MKDEREESGVGVIYQKGDSEEGSRSQPESPDKRCQVRLENRDRG